MTAVSTPWEIKAAKSGNIRPGGWVYSSPTVASYGTVYVGSDDGYLYALNSDGSLKWRYKTGGWVWSSSAIGSDQSIYFGSDDSCFYALTPEGTLKWSYKTGNRVMSSPAIGSDGTLYFGSDDSYFYALTPQGTLKWKFSTGDSIGSSYSLETSSSGLSISPWPKFRYDARNTGRYIENSATIELNTSKSGISVRAAFTRGLIQVSYTVKADSWRSTTSQAN